MLSPLVITSVGLLAQVFFSARSITQWIMSERAHRVLSPTIFWVFSVAGSILLATYGCLRQDFAIVAGQFVTYYIYLWNLKIKKLAIPKVLYILLMLLPFVALATVGTDPEKFVNEFFANASVPMWLLIYGTFGQFLFTVRFILQWLSSRKAGRSELPPAFWWVSLIGAMMIFSYGIIRHDIVLMLGQGFGLIVYGRNLWIGYKEQTHAEK